ncbi:MAG: STAS domain-containing protein [Thiopseudomonas sp.]|nr:STAS domain-containing protein [Thiopseudomonas sp.]
MSVELHEQRLLLAGVLDHASVPALRAQAARLLAQVTGSHLQIDCSGVTRANSAGLALVLAIMRDAGKAGKTFSVAHLPADMQQMAHVCELTAVLQPAP